MVVGPPSGILSVMFRENFAIGEFYHIYNHGIEHRDIVNDEFDSMRFLESLKIFNNEMPIGSIYEQSFNPEFLLGGPTTKLIRSSWDEYIGSVKEPMCEKDVVLRQFKNGGEYKEYAEDALPIMLERKKTEKEEKYLMIE